MTCNWILDSSINAWNCLEHFFVLKGGAGRWWSCFGFFKSKLSWLVVSGVILSCFKLMELFFKIIPSIIKVDCETRFFGNSSCVFNSSLKAQPFSCLYCEPHCHILHIGLNIISSKTLFSIFIYALAIVYNLPWWFTQVH